MFQADFRGFDRGEMEISILYGLVYAAVARMPFKGD